MPSQKKVDIPKAIAEQFAKNLPFALFRRPNEKNINGVLQENQHLNQFLDYSQKGFVFAPFDYNNGHTVIISPDLVMAYSPKKKGRSPAGHLGVNENRQYHLQLVKKGIDAIEKGDLAKVVLSRKIEVDKAIDPLEFFHLLVQTYENAYCYLFHHPKVGTWLGASPELLISVKDLKFKTTSLAGTLPVIEDNPPNWTNKEREEQEIVTLFIKDQLQKAGVNVTISRLQNAKAGKLWHLKSILKGQLTTYADLAKVLQRLHPTPAVCGLPKTQAKDFILAHENYSREYYTGFMGELNHQQQNSVAFYVNLRCLKAGKNATYIYVGGGITQDSNPEAELQETINKSRTMLDLF